MTDVTYLELLGQRNHDGCPESSRGPVSTTYSGTPFHALDPDPASIHIDDIARSLSHLSRFNGHTSRFYSVAEHSVLAADMAERMGQPVSVQRWALMHDASETYVGDMIRPLKKVLPEFEDIEERVQRAIARRFNLPWPMYPIVKDIDNILGSTEKHQLLPNHRGHAWSDMPDPDEEICLLQDISPETARRAFIHAFYDLFPEEVST